MAAALRASILCRDLTLQERRRELERTKAALASTGSSSSNSSSGSSSTQQNMLTALEEARQASHLFLTLKCVTDLKSTLVPMRARGVVTLTRLLRGIAPQLKAAQQAQQLQQTQQQQQQRPLIVEVTASATKKSAAETAAAAATLATVDKFMDTYVDMIQDEESYVYLAAVQGLSVLADAAPLHCIPRLVALFCGTPQPLSPAATATATAAANASVSATGSSVSNGSSAATSTATAAIPLQQQLQQQQHQQQQQQQQQPTLAQRLKLGEAVMFAARRCGEAMPVYARYFVGAFVVGARERVSDAQQDELSAVSEVGLAVTTATKERIHFRASNCSVAYSNCLALQLTSVSTIRLHKVVRSPYAHDIVDVALGVLSLELGNNEESVHLRRAAAYLLSSRLTLSLSAHMVYTANHYTNTSVIAAVLHSCHYQQLTHTLRGCGPDAVHILPHLVKPVYRALQRVAKSDGDEVARFHARAGLSEIDTFMRQQLFPHAS
eukprot:15494-Heterococcus_DN1.PRE.1